jgi:hypothetical protein
MLQVLLILSMAFSLTATRTYAGDSASESAVGMANTTPTFLERAIAYLESTGAGKKEMNEAKSAHIEVVPGTVSKTDITAIRSHGEIRFQVQVQIAADKDPVFQALDLAHELTHALNPKKNPFDPSLNASEYIRHGIESAGGEAAAIAQECSVGKELSDLASVGDANVDATKNAVIKFESAQLIRARCHYVWQTASSPAAWKNSFYFLGQHYREFVSRLAAQNQAQNGNTEAPFKLDPRTPVFASAVAHKPYPLALLEEYLAVTKTICHRARATLLPENSREIASTTPVAPVIIEGPLESRCRGVE